MESEKKLFLRNIVGFSFVTWVSFLVGVLSQPIATRLFSPDQLGVINMFNINANLFVAFSMLGLDQAFVRFYHERPSQVTKKYFATILPLASLLFLSIVGILVSIFFWRQVSADTFSEANQLLVVAMVAFALARTGLRFLNLQYRVEQNIKWFSIQGILAVVTTKILYLAVAFWNATYTPAIIVLTITNVVLTIVFTVIQRKSYSFRLKLPDKNFIKTISVFAIPLIPVTIIAWLNNSISAIVVTRMLGFYSLGIYTAGLTLAGTINIIQAGFNAYWAPYVFQNYKTHAHHFKSIHKLLACCVTFFGLAIIILQEPAFLLLGERFRGAMHFFAFLLIAPICYTLAETTGLGIGISKKTYWNPIIFVISILFNVIACLILIPRVGLAGAGMASALGGIISLTLRTIIGERYYKSIQSYKHSISSITLLIMASLASYLYSGNRAVKYSILAALLMVAIIIFSNELGKLFITAKEMVQNRHDTK